MVLGRLLYLTCSLVLIPPPAEPYFLMMILSNIFPPHRIARLGIARTFQIVKPFAGLTVLENTMIGALRLEKSLIKAKAKALDILRVLQLENEKDTLADCLTLPDKKRLEIARALAIQPKLLLLDEVMAGLRPVEIDQFINTIQHLKQHLDLTIMMIEHNMRAIMACCQRVIVLHQGQKIAVDTPNAIQQHPEVIKTYLGTGFTYPFQGKI